MTIQEIYNQNIKLQYTSNVIVRAVHQQNYDKTLRSLRLLTGELSVYLTACMEQKNTIGIDIAEYGIGDFLNNIMEAQKASDYILIADLLEMQMMPFLLSVQESMRNNCDVMFCQDIWDENIKKLKDKDGKLATLVEAEQKKWLSEENPTYWIEPTNSGLFTMASQDEKSVYYLHSNSNPQLEALDFGEYYYDLECEKYLVLGLGLGYHCKALADKDEGINISIYENNLQVIVQAMMANNLDWLWDSDKVTLVYDSDLKELSRQLVDVEDGNAKTRFIIHYPSLRHITNESVKVKLEQLFIRDSGIRNTKALLESNFRENIKHYTGTVDDLRSQFEGKRAVIVAAGPSLDQNVELLLHKPKDVIIVATGTVFRKLEALGIDMDFVVVSDANRRVFWQVSSLLDSNVPLLYLSTSYQGFAQKYKGEKYIIFQKDFESAEEVAKELNVNTYSTGGSVSTTALDVCIRLGCAEIAFIGLDLAYTSNFAHAEGTSRRVANDIEDMPEVEGYEIDVEGTIDADLDKEKVPTARIKKVQVFSSKLFNLYRQWIERRIKEPDVHMPVYDASEGGSIKTGMKICTLEEYLKKE